MARLICPHCRNPIEIVDPNPHTEISCPSCGSNFQLEDHSTTDWKPLGQKLGKFELIETVGQGAFGTVYRARDTELDRFVAIKMPRAGNLPETSDIDRFLREARSVAQLKHPFIVSIHEVAQKDGLPFLVSDFVEGNTLADLLSARTPSPQQAAQWIAAVAEALDYSHQHGIVHRDIKPTNIIIRPDGSPCLMDFGLAKRDAGEITMTIDGQVLGTPAYMSPEQARGQSHKVDGRSDVYSLGVILYQMLTGELPFRGTTRMLLHQVLHDEPRPPRSLNDRIPRDLQTICLKAMAKEPGRRYASAEELAEDLQRFLKGEPIKARPVGRIERTWRWCKRKPAAAALMVVSGLALLALVALGVGLVYQGELREAYDMEAEARKEAENRQKDAEATAQLAEQRLWQVKKAQSETGEAIGLAKRYAHIFRIVSAQNAWQQNELLRMKQLLDECQPEQRGWEWRYLKGLSEKDFQSFPMPSAIDSLAVSPDGRLMAASLRDNSVKVWELQTGKEVMNPKGPKAPVHSLGFSPDGRFLAANGSSGHGLWDLQTGKAILPFEPSWRFVNGLTFSPDGKLFGCGFYGIHSLDVLTGKATEDFSFGRGDFTCLAFSPDGRLVARGYSDHTVGILNLQSQKENRSFKNTESPPLSLQFSPDSRWVAVHCSDGIKILDSKTGIRVSTLDKILESATSISFSSDGNFLATGSKDQGCQVWNLPNGELLKTLKGHEGPVLGVVFSPDNRWLATGGSDKKVKIWDMGDSKGVRVLFTSPKKSPPRLAFSPDGKLLAIAGPKKTVLLWDTLSGGPFSSLKGLASDVAFVAFSPKGELLATAHTDQTARLWDVQEGKEKLKLQGHAGEISAIVFDPIEGQVATACFDGSARVWDISTGKVKFLFEGHSHAVTSLAYHPWGKYLATAGMDRKVHLWDLRSGKIAFSLEGNPGQVYSVAFNPDGDLLATSSWSQISLWDARTGGKIATLDWKENAASELAFSPDGRLLAAGGRDKTVMIWDVATRKEIVTLKGLPGSARNLAFSPKGDWLAVSCDEGSVLLWEGIEPDTRDSASRWQLMYKDAEIWHQAKVAEAERTENWPLVISHLTFLIKLQPKNGTQFLRRGMARIRLGQRSEAKKDFDLALKYKESLQPVQLGEALGELEQWEQAAKQFQRAIQESKSPLDFWFWHRLALLRLKVKDEAGYHETCSDMLKRFGKVHQKYPGMACSLTWCCVLAPKPDWKMILTLSESAVQADKKNWFSHVAVGAACYRARDYDSALASLHQAIKLHGKGGHPTSWLFLAMTYHHLQQPQEAKFWLMKAANWMNMILKEAPETPSAQPLRWFERLELQILFQEAKSLILGG